MEAIVEQEIQQVSQQRFEITCDEDLPKINAVLKGIKGLKSKVCDELDPRIKLAHESHKSLTALRKKYLQPLEDVEGKINQCLKDWTVKKEAEAKELQEKINKQLAEGAEQERKRLEAEALTAKDEWSKEVALEKASEVKPETVDLTVCKEAIIQKQEGQYKRSNWKCRIIDWTLIPREYLVPNEKLLNELAKEQKEKFKVNGCEAWDDFSIVTKM